jgi:hypothetical protein
MITLVVFSKDRAMQLDSLLQSVKDHCTGIDRVMVVAKASNALHAEAYRRLRKDGEYDDIVCDDVPIGRELSLAIEDSVHTALAVDDMTFYAPSDFKKATEELNAEGAFVWSWRLGWRKPGVEWDFETFWYCSALSPDPDYGYLWHTDGSLYKTEHYVRTLDMHLPDWRTGSYTPNDLEAAVVARAKRWKPLVGPHLGPLQPTCITWQLNRVQMKYGSPAAEIPETNVDALAKVYLEGKRVDNDALYGMLNANPLRWNPPGARPTHVYACEEASRFWASCIR